MPVQFVSCSALMVCSYTPGASKKLRNLTLLAGLSHKLGLVLGQVAVSEKSNEITAFFDLIELLVLEGLVITGDAMFTQRHIAEKIISKRGDDLLSVKANQPSLLEDIKQHSRSSWMCNTLAESKMTDAYGGRIEERTLKVSTAMSGYSDWQFGLRRVLKMERKITTKRTGVERQEEAYAITSLDEKRASAEVVDEAVERALAHREQVALRQRRDIQRR